MHMTRKLAPAPRGCQWHGRILKGKDQLLDTQCTQCTQP